MTTHPRLIAIGASHHSTPVEVRERLSIPPERLPDFYRELRETGALRESLVLSTCNRLEVYGVASDAGTVEALETVICGFQQISREEFARHRYALLDREAVRHLLEVASGADSQIVGETEIFGQVKTAYSSATNNGSVGPILNRVVQKCFQAAKHIRSTTPIGEGQVSVATVAVDLAEKIFGTLKHCRVLVLGTGEVGEKTARAIHSRGAGSITVLSRAAARAQALAAAVNARHGTLDELAGTLVENDIVVGSTTATAPIVTESMVHTLMRARRLRPLFFIDLGLPRNFEPGLGHIDSVFLYDLDDLARIADENLAGRRAAVERCRKLADDKAAQIWGGVLPRFHQASAAADDGSFETRGQTA